MSIQIIDLRQRREDALLAGIENPRVRKLALEARRAGANADAAGARLSQLYGEMDELEANKSSDAISNALGDVETSDALVELSFSPITGIVMDPNERALAVRDAGKGVAERCEIAARVSEAEQDYVIAMNLYHLVEKDLEDAVLRDARDRVRQAQDRVADAKRKESQAVRSCAGAAAELLALSSRLGAEKDLERCLMAVAHYEAFRDQARTAHREFCVEIDALAKKRKAELDHAATPLLAKMRRKDPLEHRP